MSPRVLIVDDDPAIRRLTELMLAHYGYTPLVARDAYTALAQIQAEQPDLILLDLNLPGMPGWELCQHLKTTTSIPVIIMSGRSPTEPDIQEVACQADAFLVKPFGVDEMLEVLNQCMPINQPMLQAS